MENLSYRDLQDVLAALEILHSDVNPLTLPERTMQAVLSLIPNEITAFDGFGTDNHYSGSLWYSPAGTVPVERIEILAELVHENPYYRHIVFNRKQEAARVTQYISAYEFQNTALYDEFYRHIGGDTQMATALIVSPELYVTCSVHRVKTDFTDRDLDVLKIISPHLISAFRHAQFINKLKVENGRVTSELETIQYGIITLDANLNVRSQDITAINLLRKYFDPLSLQMPDELIRYVRHCRWVFTASEVFMPPVPLEIRKNNSKLKISPAFQAESQSIVLLLEESIDSAPADLTKLGLTKREAEILFLMAKGKADADIAALCYISLRTVHKHRENIFNKLGVETRTAAMLRAIEVFK